MRDYPLYNVRECERFINMLEYMHIHYAEKIAFQNKTKSWNYNEIYKDVLNCIVYFKKYNRNYFCITAKNSYYFFVMYFAIVISNNIAVLVNGTDGLKDIERIVDTVIVVDDSFALKLINTKNECGQLLLKALYKISNLDVCTIVQSSGTTSISKGVELSQKNLISDTVAGMKYYKYEEGARYLNILPYSHLFGVVADLMGPLYSGGTICFSNNKLEFFENLRRFKPTNLNLPPVLVNGIYHVLKKTSNYNYATGGALKKILCAGAKMDDSVNEEFSKFAFRAYAAYGLTECSPCVCMSRDKFYKKGSVGKVLSCCDIKIVNDEVVVRGDNVMIGYFQEPSLTAQVLKEGWLYTGDIGYLDSDNFLFLKGRKSNLIVFEDGTKLMSESLEGEIDSIDMVQESLVASVTMHNKIMCTITVVVNDLNNKNSINSQIIKICKKADLVQKLCNITITDVPLPKNELGKIIRNIIVN